ncbi:hypothetical protein MRX96_030492 [Rhipicephalus microplus]
MSSGRGGECVDLGHAVCLAQCSAQHSAHVVMWYRGTRGLLFATADISCLSSLRHQAMMNFWFLSRVKHRLVVTSAASLHSQKNPQLRCRFPLTQCLSVAVLRQLLTSSLHHQLPRHRLFQLPLQNCQRQVCAHGQDIASGLLCG